MVDHALALGFGVEVFSNRVHVDATLWETFSRPRVSLATSYSDRAGEHGAATQRRGSHTRTWANIAEAMERSIPIRVGIIDLRLDSGSRKPDGNWRTSASSRLAMIGSARWGAACVRQSRTSISCAGLRR